ncbi:MAG: thiamine diphosphokinase [Candidatus Kapaibacterium sp.]
MIKTSTILILNGDIPSRKIFNKFYKKGDYVICADGGANSAARLGILPNIIIGDLDSITKSNLNIFKKKGVEIRKIKEQETTDFEKALMYIVVHGLNNVFVFGAVSCRPDHTLNNFSVLKRYYKLIDIKIIDKDFEIFYLNKEIKRKYRKGKVVSLMGMPIAIGVSSNGLKYKLNKDTLDYGIHEGTLNVSSSDNISIRKEKGDLLVFLSIV